MKSPLFTEEMLKEPMIDVVSYLKQMRMEAGQGLIDLSVGNPDLPPCQDAIDELVRRRAQTNIHGYGNFDGQPCLIDSIIRYYKTRYGVDVARNEINITRGVRTMLFSTACIFTSPGDLVLVPSIGYQSYFLGATFCHAQPYFIPMPEDNCFVPRLRELPEDVLRRAKLLYLNYPNNPIGSQITHEQLQEIVDICREYEILLLYDNAYNEIVFDGRKPVSLLEIEGGKEIGIEVTSMSKLTCLAGWRIAFCVSSAETAKYIWNYNALADSAVFDGFQFAGAKALDYVTDHDDGKRLAHIYQQRRDIVLEGLDAAGLKYYRSEGGFYVWINVPEGMTDYEFSREVCRKCKVLLTPGSYYGPEGARFVRISLTASPEKLREAAKRIAEYRDTE